MVLMTVMDKNQKEGEGGAAGGALFSRGRVTHALRRPGATLERAMVLPVAA